MDSNRSSSSLPAGKIRRCTCGKRMSILKFNFHTVCSGCRGLDCDMETRCIECTDVSDLIMQDCMSHKLSLKSKLLANCKLKESLPPLMAVHEPEALAGDAPPVELDSPSVSSVVTTASDFVQSDVVGQVKSMIANFAESLEARFSQIDRRFSQVNPSSASFTQDSNVSCQDVDNRSLSALSPVAVRSGHPPDKGPSVPYSDGLGSSLGGPATVGASADADSLPRMVFANLLATVQLLEASGRVPDSFVDTLRSYVILAPDFHVAIGGASLADSTRAFRFPILSIPFRVRPREGTVLSHSFIASWRLWDLSSLVASSASALRHGGV